MKKEQTTISEGGYREQMAISPFLLQQIDNQEDKGVYFEHTGVNAGFTAYAIGNLTEGYGAVIMLNSGDDFDGLGKEIRRAIAQTYGWYKFLPESVKPVSLTEKELNQYVGRFRRGMDAVVEIRRENNYLVETITEGLNESKAIYCFPIGHDSIVFTDFNVKGIFGKNTEGSVVSLKSEYQNESMPRMKDDEFTPHELLQKGDFVAARVAYKQMNLNESQITYVIYDYMNRKKANMEIVRNLLELAEELFPKSAMVFNRWGDYFVKMKDKFKAILNYTKSLTLDTSNKELPTLIEQLKQ